MSDGDSPRPEATPSVTSGIALKVLSVAIFMAMSTGIKSLPENIPTGELVFFRSLFAVPVILVWLIATNRLRRGLIPQNIFGHLHRSCVGTAAMALMFAALVTLPLPEVTAISYAAPLIATLLAIPLLAERVGGTRLSLVGLGLVGVLVILWPRLTVTSGATQAQTIGAIVAFGAAILMGFAQILTRKLLRTETPSSVVFYFSVIGAALALVTLPFGWVMPDAKTLAILIFVGLTGGLAQVFLMLSYRRASTAVLAPFEYTSMLMALVIGYWLFDEVPTLMMLVGAALVMLAGLLVIWREWYVGKNRPENAAQSAR